MNVLGVDIGGTKIFVGRYDNNLNLQAQITTPTEAQKGKDKILKNLVLSINKVKDKNTKAFGVAWAGFVNSKKGIIVKAPNIPSLNHFPIVQYLEETIKIKGSVENDARLFALAEARLQSSIPKVSLGIIIGTGVGSGLIIEGKIFTGAHNFAGEIGHVKLEKKEIEPLIAGPGLEKFLGVKKLNEIDLSVESQRLKILKKINTQLHVFTQWLANLCLTFDPEEIVIGGGAGIFFWSFFEKEIIQVTNQKLKNYPIKLNLRFSTLKNPGAKGAAFLAWGKI